LIRGNETTLRRRTMKVIFIVPKEVTMKALERSNPDVRHLPNYEVRTKDSYRAAEQPVEPACCRDCGVVFHKGRWVWGRKPDKATPTRCPACLRILDHYPAGFLSIKGEFALAHRHELLELVRARGEHERREHPLERLMAVDEREDGLAVTTTGTHLARVLGHALKAAYDGKLTTRFNKDENRVRMTWRR
jgi:NMD protein affecting ribosome stability and mRNA decay